MQSHVNEGREGRARSVSECQLEREVWARDRRRERERKEESAINKKYGLARIESTLKAAIDTNASLISLLFLSECELQGPTTGTDDWASVRYHLQISPLLVTSSLFRSTLLPLLLPLLLFYLSHSSLSSSFAPLFSLSLFSFTLLRSVHASGSRLEARPRRAPLRHASHPLVSKNIFFPLPSIKHRGHSTI